jgi:succinate dehydrogenase/fumarate reductase flavoprotein subunit
MVEQVVETDVLVIGGGMAGCFAAIKAKEKGVDVILVDKGYVSKSGQSPFAGTFVVYNPEWGHNLDEWMNQINTAGEYLNNREWTETVFKDSYARYQDLLSYGVKCTRREGRPPPDARARSSRRVSEAVGVEEIKHSEALRKQVLKRGVKIMDRIMITNLIKQDSHVVGAIGIPLNNYDIYVFKAKATVICAGAGGFKSAGWPIRELTADGHVMAYRVGAEITGKEFEDFHSTCANVPALLVCAHPMLRRALGKAGERGMMRGRLVNAEGSEITRRGMSTMDFEAHAGRAPLFQGETPRVGGAASGMSVHTTEGIWPINTQCASSVPGLYAAGDSLGTMFTGTSYSAIGSALATAAVTGARAGLSAAEYALQTKKPTVDEKEVAKLKKKVHTPLQRKGGFSPRWVTQILQSIMIPYYIMHIKHEKRLQAALTLMEFLRDHLVPKITAKDPHELRLAHETKNMVLNAELRLRASLFRTESRGSHYREDYPRRDDSTWLAWVLLKDENGTMKVYKKPIPKAWWPDLSKPYDERYSYKFPGE